MTNSKAISAVMLVAGVGIGAYYSGSSKTSAITKLQEYDDVLEDVEGEVIMAGRLINKESGKCLHMTVDGAYEGTMQTWDCYDADEVEWAFMLNGQLRN